MGWREHKVKINRVQPLEVAPAQEVQVDDQYRQNNINRTDHPFDSCHWAKGIENLVAEMGEHDLHGDCWQWVQRNLPDEWRLLMESMKRIDVAFQQQSAKGISEAITCTKRVFHECVDEWEKRR